MTEKQNKRPEVGSVAKVFEGPEGLRMVMLRIGKESENQYLIKYWGIDHKWSGKVFKTTRESAGRGYDYIMEHEGKPYHTLIERRETWNNSSIYNVFIPGLHSADGLRISYSENESKNVIPEHLLTEYLKQTGKGE